MLYAALRDKKKVEFVYLPEIYEKVAKEMQLPKELVEAASVGHWAGGREEGGVSLKLLQLGKEAAVGAEKIRALAPGRLGLGDVLKEAAEAIKKTPLQYLVDVLGVAAVGLVLAPVLQGLVLAGSLAGVLKAVAEVAARLRRRMWRGEGKRRLRRRP